MDRVRTKTFHFLSANMYSEIYGKMWIPEGNIRAIVQISHGMAEHIERYGEFAEFLAGNGILVVGNDHMGHGKSVQSEDDLGYFAIPVKGMSRKKREQYSSSAQTVKDLLHITKIVKKHYPGVPYILLGHSMGSFLVRRYLMECGEEMDGAILMGTGHHSSKEVCMGRIVNKCISLIKGERYRSKILNRILFGAYNRRIENKTGKSDWVTSDEKKRTEYDNDKRCGFIFTMNGIEALLSTLHYIVKPENIEKMPTNIKMMVLSGNDDPVGNYGEGVKKMYQEYVRHGISDISIKLYDECRHELLNEKIKDVVYKDIFDWIDEHVIYAYF